MPPRSGRPPDDPFPAQTPVGGRYLTLKRLGHGGYGVVYQALQQELGTHVVLKFLKREHHDQYGRVAQFKQEAEAPGKIRVGVAKCLDYHEDLDGYPCQVLEYIPGPDLRTHLAKEGGPLPYETTLQIAIQLARTLVAAHRVGIVHRDLTPSNVMLTDERLPRMIRTNVIDWGIAAWLGNTATSTLAPQGGPPQPYLPPEDTNPVRPAYDLFTFGVILYEMLVGQPPEPTSFSSIRQAEGALAEPLKEHSSDLRKLLAGCLQQSPHDRPNADEARRVLERLLIEEEQRPLRDLREQNQQAQGQIKLLEEQSAQQRKRSENEYQQVITLQARLTDAEGSHEQTKALLRQREQANSSLAHQHEQLRTDLEARCEALRKERDRASDQFTRELKELEEKLAAVQQATSRSQTEREGVLAQELADTLRVNADLLAANEQLTTQLLTATQRVQDSENSCSELHSALVSSQSIVTNAAKSQKSAVRMWGLGLLIGSTCLVLAFSIYHFWPLSAKHSSGLSAVPQRAPETAGSVSVVRQELPAVNVITPSPLPAPVEPHWKPIDLGVSGSPLRILDIWANAKNMYAVGEQCTNGCNGASAGTKMEEHTRGILLRSTAHGQDWQELPLPGHPAHLYAVRGDAAGNVYIGSDGALFRITDTGTTRHPATWASGSGRQVLRDVFLSPEGSVYAVSAAPGGHLFAFQFPSQGEPIIQRIKLPTGDSLQAIHGEGDVVWIVGTGGALIRTAMDLSNRQKFGMLRNAAGMPLSTSPLQETLHKVHVRGASVMACGAVDVPGQIKRGVLYSSSDHGKQWTRTALDIPCYAMNALRSGDVLLGGYGKKLIRISERLSPREDIIPLLQHTSNIKSLWGHSGDDLYVAGWNGLFLYHGPG